MKKIIGLLLVLSVFCPLGINVFAQDTLDGKITLTHFLGVDEDNAKTVTLLYGGNTYTVDKAKFFDLADSIILTSTLDPQETDMDGIYITAQTNSGEYCYAYLSKAGGADKYSLAMSRLPYALYTVNDLSQISNLISLGQTNSVSDWAKEAIDQAVSEQWLSYGDFNGNYTQNITRERFCDVAYAGLLKNGYEPAHSDFSPFTDISSPTVSSLYRSGIISGKSETMFAPNDYITREEAATILYRMAKFMNIDLPDVFDSVYFDDEAEISDWALMAVKVMRDMGVMNGTSDNIFSPDDVYTVEQAIVTMVRLYGYNNH